MKLFSSSIHSQARRMLVGAIFMIFLGIRGIYISQSIDGLKKITGVVDKTYYGVINIEGRNKGNYGILIELNDHEKRYGTWVEKLEKIIKNKVKANDSVEIWLSSYSGEIVQLKVSDELLIEYNRFSYLIPDFFFLSIGALLLFFLLRIILKHPELISAHIARSKCVNLDE